MKHKKTPVIVAVALVLTCSFVVYYFTKEHARLKIKGHVFGLSGLGFSPDGKLLVSAAHDGRVKVWDSTTGELKSTLHFDHNGMSFCRAIHSLSLSLKSNIAAISLPDTEIVLWPYTEGLAYRTVDTGHAREVTRVAISPDGNLVASGSLDGTVRLWNERLSSSIKAPLTHGGAVMSIVFFPNGEYVASGGEDGAVFLWDINKGTQRPIMRADKHHSIVRELAVSPDSNTIAAGVDDGTIKVLKSASGDIIQVLQYFEEGDVAPFHAVNALCFSPNGDILACSCGKTWGIKMWRTNSWQICDSHRIHPVACMAFSSDGKTLATGGFSGKIILWDVRNSDSMKEWCPGPASLDNR